MFVRKKKNRSRTTSAVITDKSGGRFRELQTIGVSSDEKEISDFYQQGKKWISHHRGDRDMFAIMEKEREEKEVTEHLLNTVENILLNGIQLILNQVSNLIGFAAIEDDILKHLVISRLCQPTGKSGTMDYLKSYFDEDIKLHKIYRYLDRLYNTQQESIQQISLAHTRKILGGKISLLFCDVTTRIFSKDGKHAQLQVVLGLPVSRDGYPLSYSLFNGSQCEGKTMIPVVEDFVRRFNLDDFVIVADSGLMNKINISLLEFGRYKYIIGARIKNETEEIKQWIRSLDNETGKI
ncbi:MAG: hypothetical protein FWF53_09880 [Candidatus Azobacteroides sp.]|nr:hypothetical protein [Candidatus Azobacteroides sp.]